MADNKTSKVASFIKSPRKALYSLAGPIIVGMVVQVLYNLVDTAYVGRLGSDALAGITFTFPLFFLLIAANSGIGSGMSSRISRYLGSREKKNAENTAMHGLLLSVILAVIVFGLGTLLLNPLLVLFGAAGNVLSLAEAYMSVILIGVFLMFPAYAYNSIFTAQGDTKTPMKIQIASLVLNAILDYVFIFMLNMGIAGAAWATNASFALSLLLSFYYIRRKSYLHIHSHSFRFSREIVWEIIRVGFPASLMVFILSVYVVFINWFMVHFGNTYVAAFGIASRLESVAMLPVIGFAAAMLTLAGMFHGAKKQELTRKMSWYSIRTAALLSSLVGVVFFIFPKFFLGIFTGDANLLSVASAYLRIDVFTFPLMAVSTMVSRIMQGIGHGMPGMIINLVRIFFVAVPLGYVFVFLLGYGYLSVAIAMVIGGIVSNVVAISWLLWEFRKMSH